MSRTNEVNCGLLALEQFVNFKTVSMFTLLHLAKDNDVLLYFCKAEPEDLIKIPRPAILHQKDHFVFIKDDEIIPEGEYDGYVLTPKPWLEPLPFSLAKKIKGGKKGSTILKPIVVGIASIINPALGAVVGAAAGAHTASKTGEWWRVPLGGATGFLQGVSGGTTLGIGNAKLAAGLAAAGEMPTAIKTGNYLAPVAAGLGQYAGATFIGGAQQGLANSTGGVLSNIGGALKGGIQAFTGGSRKPIVTPSSFSTATGETTVTPGAVSGRNNNLGLLGVGLSAAIPQPDFERNMGDNYSKAAQYLGGENWKSLPTATREQLSKYTNMSISDLAAEFKSGNTKAMRQLEEQKQKAKDAITAQYANYGQDPYTSTDAQKQIADIDSQYAQAAAELEEQTQTNSMNQAIEFKKQILQQSIQQNTFDNQSFLDLATFYGMDQEAKYALESKNYEMMQEVLAQIFQMT